MTETLVMHGVKVPRAQIVAALRARDGDNCQYPGAEHPLDFSVKSGPKEITLDHTVPQWYCKEMGWSREEMWALSNLKLFCKMHNAKKGDLLLNDDGTLPEKPMSNFRFRRHKRAQRSEVCQDCQSGRLLGENDWCNACGSGPNPGRYPKWRQMQVKQCDHDLFYCVSCTIWFPEQRRSALDALLTGGNGYE